MAKPKFRRLNYDLYETLMRARLAGATYQVVLAVIDQTIGYRKESARISLSEFQDKTRLSRQSVIIGIKDATAKKIFTANRDGVSARKPVTYSINEMVEEWLTGQENHTSTLVKQIIPDQSSKSYQTSQAVTPATAIESNYKENIKKDNEGTLYEDSQGTPTVSPSGKPLPFSRQGDTPLHVGDTALGGRKAAVLSLLKKQREPITVDGIAKAIQERNVQLLRNALSNLKKRGLIDNPYHGLWLLKKSPTSLENRRDDSTWKQYLSTKSGQLPALLKASKLYQVDNRVVLTFKYPLHKENALKGIKDVQAIVTDFIGSDTIVHCISEGE